MPAFSGNGIASDLLLERRVLVSVGVMHDVTRVVRARPVRIDLLDDGIPARARRESSPEAACDTSAMRRDLGDGYELDDDPARTDVDAVHAYLAHDSYWARGRPREVVERLVREASRVVGLFHNGSQVGFGRAVTDGIAFVYLADVYVLPEHRGRGLGLDLVREIVERGPYADRKWLLHTEDAHELYRKLGFDAPNYKVMERPPPTA